jgi:hypothetical protein
MKNNMLEKLEPKARRGSNARCHLLNHGSKEQVAQRLTDLITPWGRVDVTDTWMPQGFENQVEAQLGRGDVLLDPAISNLLVKWWLAVPYRARVPNWDIASTCTINGRKGLLLIEAKAHDEELNLEQAGKKQENNETENSHRNRIRITQCMSDANKKLAEATGLPWALSIEHNYQISNRFAWAWKLTELGMSAILVYLGFLQADEMNDRGITFTNNESWTQLVLSHSKSLFPPEIWNRQWTLNGQVFIPLIKSLEIPIDTNRTEVK